MPPLFSYCRLEHHVPSSVSCQKAADWILSESAEVAVVRLATRDITS